MPSIFAFKGLSSSKEIALLDTSVLCALKNEVKEAVCMRSAKNLLL